MAQHLITHVAKLAHERAYRGSKGLCLVSGKKLLSDLGKQHVFEDLLLLDRAHKKIVKSVSPSPAVSGEGNVSGGVAASSIPNLRSVNVSVPLEPELLQRIAGAKDPDGILGVGTLKIPPAASIPLSENERLVVAIDASLSSAWRDTPGVFLSNLATIMRTALAFNYHSVNFCDKAIDLFDPETIRASQGALWTLPYRTTSLNVLVAHAERYNLWPAQLVLNNQRTEQPDMSVRLEAGLRNKRGVLLLVTGKPRKDFVSLQSSVLHCPFQVAVSTTLYDIRRFYDLH